MQYQLTPQIITEIQSNQIFQNLLDKYNVVSKFNIKYKNELSIFGYSEDLLVIDQQIQTMMKKFTQTDYSLIIDDEIVFNLIFRNHEYEITKEFAKFHANLDKNFKNMSNPGQKVIKFMADEDDHPTLRNFVNNLESNIKKQINIQKILCTEREENIIQIQKFQKELLKEFPIEIITANQNQRLKELHLTREINYLTYKINLANLHFGSSIPYRQSLDAILLFIDLYGDFQSNSIEEIAKLSETASDIIKVINQFQSRLAKKQRIKLQKLESYITMKKQIDFEKITYGIVQKPTKFMNYPNFLAYYTIPNCINEFLSNIYDQTKIGISLPKIQIKQKLEEIILAIIDFLVLLNASKDFYLVCDNEQQVETITEIMKSNNFEQQVNKDQYKSNDAQPLKNYVQQFQNIEQITKWSFKNDKNIFQEYDEDEQFLFNQAQSQNQSTFYFTKQMDQIMAVKCQFDFQKKILQNDGVGLSLQIKNYPKIWDIMKIKAFKSNLEIYIDEDGWKQENQIIDVSNYYKINFLKKYQKNLATKKKRDIQYITESKQIKKSQYSWHFSFKDSFQKMDEENSKIIELGYQKLFSTVQITRPAIDYGYSTLEVNTNDISIGIDWKSKAKTQQQISLKVIQQLDQSMVKCLALNYAQLGILKFNLYYESANMYNLTYFYQVDLKQMCQINNQTNAKRSIQRVLEEQKEELQLEEPQKEESNRYFYLRGIADDLNKSASLIYEKFQQQALMQEDFEFPFVIESQIQSEIAKISSKLKTNVTFQQKKVILKGQSLLNQFLFLKLGTQDKLKKVSTELYKIIINNLKNKAFSFPEEFNQLQIKEKVKLIELKDSKEYNEIKEQFQKELPQVKIIKIEQILNKYLYTNFYKNTEFLKLKYDNQQTKSKLLFHGTRGNDPKLIYEGSYFIKKSYSCCLVDEGFDMRISNGGMWGKGIYFSDKSSYSNSYAYSIPNKVDQKQMFLAQVNVGKFVKSQPDQTLTRPPLQPASKERYDSIEGDSQYIGAKIYVVYQNDQVYPKYLITYQDPLIK